MTNGKLTFPLPKLLEICGRSTLPEITAPCTAGCGNFSFSLPITAYERNMSRITGWSSQTVILFCKSLKNAGVPQFFPGKQ